ncbi:MAG: TMEM165/GDT1 family protein [Nitriliruptoraceae bacterium]
MIAELASAFGLVFLAELGDKSMLLAVAFALRYRPWPVLGGIAIAAFTMLGLSTLVGTALGAALPERAVTIGGGVLFLAFGLWTLLDRDEDEEEDAELRSSSVLLGVTLAFLVAEFGDKTMLATLTLAGGQAPLPTWLGAGAGMTAASGLAIAIAVVAGARLPERILHLLAAGAFLLFGVLLLVAGLRG